VFGILVGPVVFATAESLLQALKHAEAGTKHCCHEPLQPTMQGWTRGRGPEISQLPNGTPAEGSPGGAEAAASL